MRSKERKRRARVERRLGGYDPSDRGMERGRYGPPAVEDDGAHYGPDYRTKAGRLDDQGKPDMTKAKKAKKPRRPWWEDGPGTL